MGSKKGYWTLTRLVKVTYTARDDYGADDYDEAITLKAARTNADRALDDVNSDADFNGISIEPVAGSKWEEEDYEEPDDDE